MELVRLHGTRKWTKIGEGLSHRTGKQCRERCDENQNCIHL